MEKADHVSPSSAATPAPLAGMGKISDPCLHFSRTGGKGQCASDLCNCDRCLHPGRAESLTSGCQDRFASVPLLIPPASEQPSGTILVEEGPSLPLIKPQSPNTYSPCSKLGQSVVFNQEQVIQKDRNSELSLPLVPALATCCVSCQWYWWHCPVSSRETAAPYSCAVASNACPFWECDSL